MARKRMFDLAIINQDSFLDLPMEAKAIYFLLGMEADDEGFVSPRKVLRLYGGTEDSLKILILKQFIIPFESGVVVITDWKNNNWLDKRRIQETIYKEEKSLLTTNSNTNKYEFNNCLASAKQMLRENRIEENSIEENSIDNKYIVEKLDDVPYKEIIDYLNSKTNSNYKHTTTKTKKMIKTRFKEGFNEDDFKTVIDNMCREWLRDEKMKMYLRPETLFGTKFESYLNRPQKELTTEDLNLDVDWGEFFNG